MIKSEALAILATKEEKIGSIEGIKIVVTRRDIEWNLEQNDFELDLTYTQDMVCIRDSGEYEVFQGHSLSEVAL